MLTNAWKTKTKRWGHPLHAMCAYVGVFPPSLPHYFIQKFTRRGQTVLDPFCGRGTTPLQAAIEGRVGVGVDADPLAHVLTAAKVRPPDPVDLRNRLDFLSNDMFFAAVEGIPREIRLVFHPETLSRLVYLRQELNPEDPTDGFILAVLLGILHGGGARRKGAGKSENPHFLSAPIPNVFGLSPGHVEKYLRERGVEAPRVDVFRVLRTRTDGLLRHGLPQTRGRAWRGRVQDLARLADPALKGRRVRLICTEPPHPRVIRYGNYNWLRLWFLGESYEDAGLQLDRHRSLEDYLAFMTEACRNLYRVLEPGGVCALAIGDLKKGGGPVIRLAEEVWARLKRRRTRFQLARIIEDPPVERGGSLGRREKGAGDSERAIDRVLVLYKGEYEEACDRVAW